MATAFYFIYILCDIEPMQNMNKKMMKKNRDRFKKINGNMANVEFIERNRFNWLTVAIEIQTL